MSFLERQPLGLWVGAVGATVALAGLGLLALGRANPGAPSPPLSDVPTIEGPWLFVDDSILETLDGVVRQVVPAKRFRTTPVVTSGPGHRNWQPWVTVLASLDGRPFRMWYNASRRIPPSPDESPTVLGYLTSPDGLRWLAPFHPLETIQPLTFGARVLDRGEAFQPPDRRFAALYFAMPPAAPPESAGIHLAFSRDGMTWQAYEANPVIRSGLDDIVDVTWDGTESRYILTMKLYRQYTWTGSDNQERTDGIRLVGIAYSPDLVEWSEPRVLFAPDRADPGVTEWYGSCCIQRRGPVFVGFLKVSRDDLAAPGNDDEEDFGYGYTTLLWSRDGTSWSRGRHPDVFLAPDPDPGAWDRSHAWIDSMIRVRDELFLYYGGYRSGHKGNRFSDRQLGVVKVPVDRFVALVTGDQRGRIVTRPFRFSGDELSLNVVVPRRRSVDIRVLDSDANPIRGFDFRDCSDAAGDSVRRVVRCRGDVRTLTGTVVRLEALLPPRTRLFALNVCSSGDPRPCP